MDIQKECIPVADSGRGIPAHECAADFKCRFREGRKHLSTVKRWDWDNASTTDEKSARANSKLAKYRRGSARFG